MCVYIYTYKDTHQGSFTYTFDLLLLVYDTGETHMPRTAYEGQLPGVSSFLQGSNSERQVCTASAFEPSRWPVKLSLVPL